MFYLILNLITQILLSFFKNDKMPVVDIHHHIEVTFLKFYLAELRTSPLCTAKVAAHLYKPVHIGLTVCLGL